MDPSHAAMREFIYSNIDFGSAKSVLDLGCGNGYDLVQMGRRLPSDAVLVGLDSRAQAVEAARGSALDDPRLSFGVADASERIPFESERFDVVLSNNMLECIVDKDALVKEAARVLKPGGQIVFAHFDWDSQLFDGPDKALVRKIVQAFNDWQQDWMTDSDAWMGRRLWGMLNRSGLFEGGVKAFVMTNTVFGEPYFGYNRARDFEALVRRDMITQQEYDTFYEGLQQLSARDEFFYSINMYVYAGRKR